MIRDILTVLGAMDLGAALALIVIGQFIQNNTLSTYGWTVQLARNLMLTSGILFFFASLIVLGLLVVKHDSDGNDRQM
jgi:hypothetical protein